MAAATTAFFSAKAAVSNAACRASRKHCSARLPKNMPSSTRAPPGTPTSLSGYDSDSQFAAPSSIWDWDSQSTFPPASWESSPSLSHISSVASPCAAPGVLQAEEQLVSSLRSDVGNGRDDSSDSRTSVDIAALMLHGLLALILGSLAIMLLRSVGLATTPSQTDGEYMVTCLIEDFRTISHFVIGLLLCIFVQEEKLPWSWLTTMQIDSTCLLL